MWVALQFPLVFQKYKRYGHSEPDPRFPAFEPDAKNVSVPEMKKGDMLVFVSSKVAHGSVKLLGGTGDRVSVAFL